MACNANKAPFLRVIAKRGFAASAVPRPVGKPASVQVSEASNNVVVATAESALPVSRVSLVFRAGSRFETYNSLGASHMMRIAAGLSTQCTSGFVITRNIQQIGGSLSATSDREIVAYTVESTAENIECGLKYLLDIAQPAFKPWEITDSLPRVRTQVAAIPPQVQAIELAHKAAFRKGLGNSVYIPKHQIGNLSSETLLHFYENNCTAKRCAVVGTGVDHNALVGFAQQLDLGSGSASDEASSYYGGDCRKDRSGNVAHVAVAGPGAGINNAKEAAAFAVLQYAVGSNPSVKRGSVNGPFGKALASATGKNPVVYSPINASYSDAGLFGFVVSAEADDVGKAIDALSRAMKSGAVSNEDVNRGKAMLKAAVLETYANDSTLVPEMGVQAIITKSVQSAEALISTIDSVTTQDVQAAAKKAGSAKLSVGAVGNLANVPYSSDLA